MYSFTLTLEHANPQHGNTAWILLKWPVTMKCILNIWWKNPTLSLVCSPQSPNNASPKCWVLHRTKLHQTHPALVSPRHSPRGLNTFLLFLLCTPSRAAGAGQGRGIATSRPNGRRRLQCQVVVCLSLGPASPMAYASVSLSHHSDVTANEEGDRDPRQNGSLKLTFVP